MNAPRLAALGCLPCMRCKILPHLDRDSACLSCNNCYDGAPDSDTRHDFVVALTVERAVDGWNELQRERCV